MANKKRDKLRIRQAFQTALGYVPEQVEINNAIHEHKDKSLEEIATEHRLLVDILNAAGGRGVEIADQIDSLHIASIARKVRRGVI